VTESLHTVCDLWVTYVWPVPATSIDFRFPFTWQLCSSGPAQLMRISKSLAFFFLLKNPSHKFCVPLQTLSHFPSRRLTRIVPFPSPEASHPYRRYWQSKAAIPKPCAAAPTGYLKILIFFKFMYFNHSNG